VTHREKVRLWSRQAAAVSIGRFRAVPLQWCIFRLVGWRLPPPHFLSFVANFLVFGVSFSLMAATMVVVTSESRSLLTPQAGIFLALAWVFSVAISWGFRREARRIELPRWDAYPDAYGEPR
jgi:hypothetical protein